MKQSTIILIIVAILVILGISQVFKKTDQNPLREVPREKTVLDQKSQGEKSEPTCYVGGCSGVSCSDDPNIMSTCEWRDEYSCYKNSSTKCERQANGQCGWTQTSALTQCINEKRNSLPAL